MEWPRAEDLLAGPAGGACAGRSWNLVIIPGGIWCGTARIGEI